MGLDGFDAQVETEGNLFHIFAFRNKLQNLFLSFRQCGSYRIVLVFQKLQVIVPNDIGNLRADIGPARRNRAHGIYDFLEITVLY
ncbi:MAG: hypothetical protein P8Z37_10125 [Acidobacteriota bacterium]